MTTKNADTSLTQATIELREKIATQYPARIRAAVLKQYSLLKAGKISGIPTTVK